VELSQTGASNPDGTDANSAIKPGFFPWGLVLGLKMCHNHVAESQLCTCFNFALGHKLPAAES
jgi:predicted branched-subunit amino acid permease